jgi:SSS family solute:Na+ symporter
VLFLGFGTIAVAVIGVGMGGFSNAIQSLAESPVTRSLLTRERFTPEFFLSYTFIPLSSIAFPHISIFCLTARKMSQFKPTVILYPICMIAIWLPCVFLGVSGNAAKDVPRIEAKLEARKQLATPGLSPQQRDQLRRQSTGDDVLLVLLEHYAPVWLAGILGAGIMAAVMASDSQILALSTMFTEDVFTYYGGKERWGEAVQVQTGRLFVVAVTVVAYLIAIEAPSRIFDLAVQYAFSGYSALSPLLVGALFWRRSTKWGALAVAAWTLLAVAAVAIFQSIVPPPAGAPVAVWSVGGVDVISRTPAGTAVLGYMPVVPMTLISALLLWAVSVVTPKPCQSTLARYFNSNSANIAR